MGGFLFFLLQNLTTRFFIFAKNGAKPCIASHGLVNTGRVPEQGLPHVIPAPKRFKLFYIVVCNSATIACYMMCRFIHLKKKYDTV